MASNTKTIQNSINWVSPFVAFRPLAFGTTMEPALTNANTIVQVFQSPPLKWNWNRTYVSFQTIDPVNDWQASHSYPLGYRLQDSNGNMQTVTTAGTSGGPSHPTWSTTVGGTTTDGSVTWTMNLITDYLVNVPSFGFMEQVVVTGADGTVNEVPNLTTELAFDAGNGRAHTIAPVMDDNNGNITFRFMPGLPDQIYTVTVIYQKRASLLTALTGSNGTWPMPDYLAPIYNWGFMALSMLFCGDSRFTWANQKFVGSLLAISEGLDEQAKQIFIDQWLTITDMRSRKSAKGTEGFQGREL